MAIHLYVVVFTILSTVLLSSYSFADESSIEISPAAAVDLEQLLDDGIVKNVVDISAAEVDLEKDVDKYQTVGSSNELALLAALLEDSEQRPGSNAESSEFTAQLHYAKTGEKDDDDDDDDDEEDTVKDFPNAKDFEAARRRLPSMFGTTTSTSPAPPSPLDLFVDQFVTEINTILGRNNLERVPLPDYYRKLRLLNRTGYFTATGGSFGNLNSLLRTGQTRVTRNPDNNSSTSFRVPLAFQKPQAIYEKYELKCLLTRNTGKATIDFERNLVTLDVTAARLANGTCVVDLKAVTVDRLDRSKLNLSGFNRVFNFLLNKFATGFVSQSQSDIKQRVSQRLYQQIDNVIRSQQDVCRFL